MLKVAINLLLLALVLALGHRYTLGEGSLAEVAALQKQVEAQKQAVADLQLRNQQVQRQIDSLKQGQEAIEARARQDLGLIKPGEQFYLLPAR